MAEELIGIISGTGLGDTLAEHVEHAERHDMDTPFGKPSAAILVGMFGRRNVALLNRHGIGHKLSPSEVPFAANIFALKKLGVRTILSSGAVGSLRDEIAPGHLVVVDQFIDKTYKRTSSFFAGIGAVHCELAEPACGRVRQNLIDTAKGMKDEGQETRDEKKLRATQPPSIVHRPSSVVVHPGGTYVCMEGPQFSTRAESLMHRAWGGDLIGMTAMPEAKLAREAQMCYALVALASDYDCWKPHEAGKNKQTLLAEIIGNLNRATQNCLELIKAALMSEREFVSADCPCRKSLDLAVWTDPNVISEAEREKLKVLFE
ncbi:MAG: MTAP family purine nucleoside phosphorylase [Sedimentisphaerales bacterium]|nr:MTAP family purine nucleoside phosphorylase [Sedimentisphaerales bacterium]